MKIQLDYLDALLTGIVSFHVGEERVYALRSSSNQVNWVPRSWLPEKLPKDVLELATEFERVLRRFPQGRAMTAAA